MSVIRSTSLSWRPFLLSQLRTRVNIVRMRWKYQYTHACNSIQAKDMNSAIMLAYIIYNVVHNTSPH